MERARKCAGSVDSAQRFDKGGEIDGCLVKIVDAAGGVLSGQPFVDGPVERVALGGMPHRELDGKRERQVGGELWQPFGFFCRLPGGPSDAGQTSCHVVAYAIDVVIGSVGWDQSDWQ